MTTTKTAPTETYTPARLNYLKGRRVSLTVQSLSPVFNRTVYLRRHIEGNLVDIIRPRGDGHGAGHLISVAHDDEMTALRFAVVDTGDSVQQIPIRIITHAKRIPKNG